MPSGLTMLFLGAYAGRRRDWNPLVSHSGGATGPVPVGSWNAGKLGSWGAGASSEVKAPDTQSVVASKTKSCSLGSLRRFST